MCSDTAWSIPCCAAASVSISVEGSLSAVGALLCELRNDGTEGRTEGSGDAGVRKKKPDFNSQHSSIQFKQLGSHSQLDEDT